VEWTVPDQTREPFEKWPSIFSDKLVRGVILPQLGCVSTKFVVAIERRGEGGLKTHQFARDYGIAETCSRHKQGMNSFARKVADNCAPLAALSSSNTSPGKLREGVRKLKEEIKVITLRISWVPENLLIPSNSALV